MTLFVVKYLDNGTKQWTKQFGTSSTDLADGVATDSSGNVYLVGYTYGGLDGNTNSGATVTFSWLNTTQVEQSSGLSRWGQQVVIMIMELPPTHPETSMCQETHMEDWIIIPMQAIMTSSWLSTTQVGQRQ